VSSADKDSGRHVNQLSEQSEPTSSAPINHTIASGRRVKGLESIQRASMTGSVNSSSSG